MYVPLAFRQDDKHTVLNHIRRFSFATLVTGAGSDVQATHLPLLVSEQSDGGWCLVGHLAAANPQAAQLKDSQSMAIFQGPHAYITPSWYEAGNAVPTWNYVAVHVYGRLSVIADPSDVDQLLRDTVQVYESHQSMPWQVQSVDRSWMADLARAVVAFRLNVERVDAKWKLSQNHSESRRQSVIEGLRRRGTPDDLAIADLMERSLREVDG